MHANIFSGLKNTQRLLILVSSNYELADIAAMPKLPQLNHPN
jgi:hypothetical protein